jgi:nucleoid-associated protein YgaU
VQSGHSTTAKVPTPAPAPPPRTYTVAKGDSLWAIAKKQLGQGNRWTEIYEKNRAVIGDNPDLIKPGQVLTLPDATPPGGGR